ncbi:hypothetical protein CC86DRAFT_426316 [Ophiobolus disseminans]|uniref:F-box domain-containing protein n=1 Tax=Ophiobolus disseminans TaxID=1469910 RepID=A0A6A6ZL59_9PLEO|nr:hypothetical protein CC86DRAFT_426316 [Ophiobolus disseminans]
MSTTPYLDYRLFARLSTLESDQPTKSNTSQTFNLFALPPELREQIYTHYLAIPTVRNSSGWPNIALNHQTYDVTQLAARAKFIPSLALVSYQMRDEVMCVMLRSAHTIVLQDSIATLYFSAFLASLSKDGWAFK